MGSIDKACISGFLCRLCSEMHRIVIHIYGDQGKRLCLVEKINGYLPITISPSDPLPKTICESCLRRVEQHYDLLMRLTRIKAERFKRRRTLPDNSSSDVSEEDLYTNNSDEDYRSAQSRPASNDTSITNNTTTTAISNAASVILQNRIVPPISTVVPEETASSAPVVLTYNGLPLATDSASPAEHI